MRSLGDGQFVREDTVSACKNGCRQTGIDMKIGLLVRRSLAPSFQALLLNEDSSPGLSRDDTYPKNIDSKALILKNNGIPGLVLPKIAHTLKHAQSVNSQ
jgi:hypothetical protein